MDKPMNFLYLKITWNIYVILNEIYDMFKLYVMELLYNERNKYVLLLMVLQNQK